MDKLAQIFYENQDLVYKYKDKVDVPVDDVLCVTKCSNKTIAANATINSFMELNKLKLSAEKCSKIHVGKKNNQCPQLKVHERDMKQTQK